jgi:hypothetical protein
MATIHGRAVISSADLADIGADCNLAYPSGIGKTAGLILYEDTGSLLRLVMAQGAATDSTWTAVDERTDADVASDVITPV